MITVQKNYWIVTHPWVDSPEEQLIDGVLGDVQEIPQVRLGFVAKLQSLVFGHQETG